MAGLDRVLDAQRNLRIRVVLLLGNAAFQDCARRAFGDIEPAFVPGVSIELVEQPDRSGRSVALAQVKEVLAIGCAMVEQEGVAVGARNALEMSGARECGIEELLFPRLRV